MTPKKKVKAAKKAKVSQSPTSLDFPKILVDSREKNPYIFKNEFHVCKLDTGDYTLDGYPHMFAVDRKASVSELAHNLIEERFKNELERLALIPHSYLLLEFSIEDIIRYPIGSDIPKRRWRYIRIKAPFILSALTKISLKYGVHIVYGGNRPNSQLLLEHLMTNFWKGINPQRPPA